jgi:hypothetical protein
MYDIILLSLTIYQNLRVVIHPRRKKRKLQIKKIVFISKTFLETRENF